MSTREQELTLALKCRENKEMKTPEFLFVCFISRRSIKLYYSTIPKKRTRQLGAAYHTLECRSFFFLNHNPHLFMLHIFTFRLLHHSFSLLLKQGKTHSVTMQMQITSDCSSEYS